MTHNRGSRKQGIAIVSVLIVLAAMMMLGVGSLVLTQSNLLMAENLSASSVAKANAEAGVDATVAWLTAQFLEFGEVPNDLGQVPYTSLVEGGLMYDLASQGGYSVNPDGTVAIRVVGSGPRSAEHVSEALLAFNSGSGVGGGSPFQGAVIGCEAVVVSGSGAIDSYDSRVGPYAAATRGRAAHVKTVMTGAEVVISGASPIYGNVASTGTVSASGSARVVGDIAASGLVQLTSAATYEGDVRTTGDVNVTNSATVYGSVSSNGNVRFTNVSTVRGDVNAGGSITFTNGGKVNGDATAGGTVSGVTWTDNVLGATRQNAGSVNNQPVHQEECDPIGIDDLMARFDHVPSSGSLNVSSWPYWLNEIGPTGVRQQHTETKAWEARTQFTPQQVILFGEATNVIRVSSVSVGSSGALRVSGGHVVLLVDGDFSYTGGGPGWQVDEGSSITILVKGKVHVGGSQTTKTAGGVPPINIFSSYRNNGNSPWNAGVMVDGAGRLDASIYAPYSDVGIVGSGPLYGAVRGRSVSVTGAADIHFDEALAHTNFGGGSEVEGAEPA